MRCWTGETLPSVLVLTPMKNTARHWPRYRALLEQLAPGGRLVLPVGERLVLVTRDAAGRLQPPSVHGAVRFVPLIGG